MGARAILPCVYEKLDLTLPDPASPAMFDYWLDLVGVHGYWTWLHNLVGAADHHLLQLIAKGVDVSVAHPGGASNLDALRHHLSTITRSLYCRHVDNYQSYLADLLKEIYRARPETLRSSGRQLSVTDVLQHETLKRFRDWLTDELVLGHSHGRFADLRKYFAGTLGMEIASDDEASRISLAIETRNILVHNRGQINELFLSRTGTTRPADPVRRIRAEEVDELALLLSTNARAVDAVALKKFGLLEISVDLLTWTKYRYESEKRGQCADKTGAQRQRSDPPGDVPIPRLTVEQMALNTEVKITREPIGLEWLDGRWIADDGRAEQSPDE